eukprot:scaffold482_cov247-Pinguiococcus_pyrenoidosus.AAC.37
MCRNWRGGALRLGRCHCHCKFWEAAPSPQAELKERLAERSAQLSSSALPTPGSRAQLSSIFCLSVVPSLLQFVPFLRFSLLILHLNSWMKFILPSLRRFVVSSRIPDPHRSCSSRLENREPKNPTEHLYRSVAVFSSEGKLGTVTSWELRLLSGWNGNPSRMPDQTNVPDPPANG